FDLVGMCVGHVPLDRMILGKHVEPGDVIMGIRASGIHSNGLTLARNVLFGQARHTVDTKLQDLGRTLGEELLEPTLIYVSEVIEAIEKGLSIKGLVHITSDGLLNLLRLTPDRADVGYLIEELPPIPPIFRLIQRSGNIPDQEMFQVFNMGIGFCAVLSERDADSFLGIVNKHRKEGHRIGHVVQDAERKVIVEPFGLVGKGNAFRTS
ncbi:MAG: AIR synthase-related protein, partial [Candidatus Methylomirabilaceae bacterium]